MSAQALGWVFTNSPLTGAGFVIHLAIADSVNDLYEYMFFMRQQQLATKARCSRATVGSTISNMLDMGLLERVDDADDENRRRSRHEPVRFRFLMPGTETRSVTDVQNLDIGPIGVVGGFTFEDFWAVYPRKLDPKAARRRWLAAVRNGADPADIVAGAEQYRDWPGRDARYTKYPATWLAAGSWENVLDMTVPVTENGGGRTAGNRAVLASAVTKLKAREQARTVAANRTAWTPEDPSDELVTR